MKEKKPTKKLIAQRKKEIKNFVEANYRKGWEQVGQKLRK